MNQIITYVLAVGLIASIPMVLDTWYSHWSRNKALKLLMEKASANGLDHKELQELAKELSKSPGGITGLARATMALTVIMILAVAVIHVLVEYCQKDNSQIVGNILSMLGGLLAAITGFYFGGRTAAEATEKAKG